MTWRRLRLWTVLAGILQSLLLWGLQTQFFHRACQDFLTSDTRRLGTPFSSLATEAIHAKDDVLLQQLVQALSQTPGITLACIADRQGKILAHTLPGKFGQSFKTSADWTCFPLFKNGESLGTMALWMSSQRGVRWEGRQKHLLLGLILGWGLISGFVLQAWRREWGQQAFQMETEKSARQQLQEALDRERMQTRLALDTREGWLASALEQLDFPVLVLDESQRIAGANAGARRLLDPQGALGTLRQKHLLDFAALAPYLSVLEDSLEHPARLTTASVSSPEASARFLTLRAGTSGHLHTWVYLPSKLI